MISIVVLIAALSSREVDVFSLGTTYPYGVFGSLEGEERRG